MKICQNKTSYTWCPLCGYAAFRLASAIFRGKSRATCTLAESLSYRSDWSSGEEITKLRDFLCSGKGESNVMQRSVVVCDAIRNDTIQRYALA
jgi:hypothetical protein